jgi:hypothetical protein
VNLGEKGADIRTAGLFLSVLDPKVPI